MKNIHKKLQKKYFIRTFGCAMNLADSERFRTILNLLGFKEAKSIKSADLIVFNTCSVRQKAEDRVFGLRPNIEELKSKNPELAIILTGCMARRKFEEHIRKSTRNQKTSEKREAEVKRQAPWIDIVIETSKFNQIEKRLEKIKYKLPARSTLNKIETKVFQNLETDPFLNIQRTSSTKFTAGITISHGCDHMCAYCIVPYARGREVNREFAPILQETEAAIKSGAKDIILLGQTVNRWINPKFESEYKKSSAIMTRIPGINEKELSTKELSMKTEPKDFLQLLQTIDNIERDFWTSFISSHPNYYTKELIQYISKSVKSPKGHIRPYIHLALQSGNDGILKKMRRNHTIEEFKNKVRLMKKLIPEVAVTTDIIVGFPGETEEQFQDTLKVCKELEFDQIYISEYSERKGTGSAFMNDNVPEKEKAKRKEQVNDILRETARKNNQKFLETVQKTLVIRFIKDKNIFQARTAHNKLIQFSPGKNFKKRIKQGDFITLKVTKVTPWALEGEIV